MAATTSRIALVVQAELDGAEYPTGIRVSDDEIAATPMTCHCLRGDWAHPKDGPGRLSSLAQLSGRLCGSCWPPRLLNVLRARPTGLRSLHSVYLWPTERPRHPFSLRLAVGRPLRNCRLDVASAQWARWAGLEYALFAATASGRPHGTADRDTHRCLAEDRGAWAVRGLPAVGGQHRSTARWPLLVSPE